MTDIPSKAAVSAPVPADVGKGDEHIAGECCKGWRHYHGIVPART